MPEEIEPEKHQFHHIDAITKNRPARRSSTKAGSPSAKTGSPSESSSSRKNSASSPSELTKLDASSPVTASATSAATARAAATTRRPANRTESTATVATRAPERAPEPASPSSSTEPVRGVISPTHTAPQLRKSNCLNCHGVILIDPVWDRVNCQNCGYVNVNKQPIIKSSGHSGADVMLSTANLSAFIKSRISTANALTLFQKVFVLLQCILLCTTFAYSKLFLMKACCRVSAAVLGIDGRLHKHGAKLQVVVPILLTVISWAVRGLTPKPPAGFFASWWSASEPEWPGLQAYVIELLQHIGTYIVFTQLYAWLWGNFFGTLRSNLWKIITMLVLPYFILPHIVPALAKQVFKQLLF